MTDVGNNQTVVANATYGPASELLSMGGGTWGTETRAYNSLLQLTSLSSGGVINKTYHYPGASNNGKIDYEYDALSGEQVNYTYDSLNRLATAVSNSTSAPWGQSFGYDGFGNLTNVNVISGSAPTLTTSYDPTTNHGTCSDANGNTEGNANCAGYNALPYDIENRLSASSVNSGATHYSYAPGNKRVWRGVGSNTSQYNPAITDELTFWSPAGQKLATYQLTEDYYGTQISAWQQTGTYYYFGGKLIKNAAGFVYADRLGSVGKYYPYGQDRGSGNPASGEKFATYFRDAESGLDYAVNRYESPGTGRFLMPDPLISSAKPADPGSWNRYAYLTGDPINSTDPEGLEGGGNGCDDDPNAPGCQECPNGICDPAQGPGGGPSAPTLDGLLATVKANIKKLLQDPNCAKDFKNVSKDIRELNNVKIGNLGPVKYMTEDGVVVAQQDSAPIGQFQKRLFSSTITLNSAVNWLQPWNTSVTIDGIPTTLSLLEAEANKLGIPNNINANQYMELIILHELAHFNGKIGDPDNKNVELQLWNDCIKGNRNENCSSSLGSWKALSKPCRALRGALCERTLK